ncbi:MULTISPECIES: PLP-dependent aminotransferase family protein [Rhizobium/Agrobacterium group]|uniref:Transcriptional regulator GntR family n=2 Tax=Rhizobium/Agrobacterium group TaxID=227290 RepID=B9K5M9_ALLAM|nr:MULTISPECIES: PLP-dependent aminotransferase family protein [Rhizobium/Agrobacterium group]ACM40177.1 transcriptional regulator GntR family [Allorhizobium ampelinum S4]MCF1449109.1 PLP-dependent aminotransferase family protein [Allorhizobium ampelinum]MCF1473656.1 PLP-dependent aminotransferase family protein [Allorhizobium ampelinum]MCF1485165.1 PLP-dependent aminotransferase family protein [Allorhizobium ampelinum]MCF1494923.1 PLP-dependent aminotransferase family protein [Allorhizobium a
MKTWTPDLSRSDGPRYLAIADVIEMDLKSGRLLVGDRLPPQRDLAKRLAIDFTTVARGYVEAQKRGLVATHVGRGTFVTGGPEKERRGFVSEAALDARRMSVVDFSMNMPPEPDDPDLLARMQEGLSAVATNMIPLLRYQGFGGAGMDKEAAASWLSRRGLVPSQERIFVTPGAHPALLAIFGLLAKPGEMVLSENITYPGMRSIAAQLRLNLTGLPMDADGIIPGAFAEICETAKPKALYLNPTLQNPMTLTIPEKRREEICAVARKYHVPIVEDDAYGFIPLHSPAPLAAMAPDLTWHIGGLAKCIGAGLRLAYVVVPDTKAAWPFASAMRAASVMASPLSAALATRWIEDGTADSILRFIRTEAAARQALVAEVLPAGSYQSDPISFNIWLPLTNGWTRSTFGTHMRASGIGVVASDAFTVDGVAEEAVRVCLGGPIRRETLKGALEFMGHALEGSPQMAGTFF